MSKIHKAFFIAAFFLVPIVGFCSGNVIFNEIAWTGTSESSNDEWIELANLGNEPVDLTGWRISASDGSPDIALSGSIAPFGYFLLERTDDESAPGAAADLIYAGILSNEGEDLALYDSGGNLSDQLLFSGGWPAGDNAAKKTMSLGANGLWENSRASGGTPRAENDFEEEDDAEEEEEEGTGNRTFAVFINEFFIDPSDGGDEWVELYNNSPAEIDLSGWRLEEGSGGKTPLSGSLPADGFIAVKNPKGYLNNKGDEIRIYFNDYLADRVVYGDWGGNPENNAPVPFNPDSAARRTDGLSTANDSADFTVTQTPTPGGPNRISAQTTGAAEKEQAGDSGDLFISELLPDPEGRDNEDEFIEIRNNEWLPVNLAGWIIKDKSGKKFVLSGYIPAKGYLAVYRKESGLALNNSGDSLYLFPPKRDSYSRKVDFQKAPAGQSYNLLEEGKWAWSKTPTPGAENEYVPINLPPEPDFAFPENAGIGQPVLFDSSDTSDPENDDLAFFWDFGDGFTNKLPNPEHTFFEAGNYKIILKVSDKDNSAEISGSLKVVGKKENADVGSEGSDKAPSGDFTVRISELMPDPAGSDQEEWIELENYGSFQLDLSGWQLDDQEGGSRPYTMRNYVLAGNAYGVLSRKETGIALNNNGDAARLFDPFGGLVSETGYEKVSEGMSYAIDEDLEWQWSSEPTPGSANLVIAVNNASGGYASFSYETPNLDPREVFSEYTLEDLDGLPAGEKVKVRGQVSVLPGILGSQFFYIAGTGGVQIYNYKKEFPALRMGDVIEVAGEISYGSGEVRIKTSSGDDILFLENLHSPKGLEISCEQVSPDLAGELVMIKGLVTGKKGSSLYVDDNTEEAEAYIRESTGIDKAAIKEGAKISLAGIVRLSKGEPRIMPRFPDDIILEEEAGSVLGSRDIQEQVQKTGEWELPANKKSNAGYAAVAAAVLAFFGIVWLIKKSLSAKD